MKKNYFILCVLSLLITTYSSAQVAINKTGNSPDGSALLDVQSDSLGILIPRMTEAQRDAITNPIAGLLIYQSDGVLGFYYYNGTDWGLIGSGAFAIDDLADGKTGENNVFLGEGSGENAFGSDGRNVAVGTNALYSNSE